VDGVVGATADALGGGGVALAFAAAGGCGRRSRF